MQLSNQACQTEGQEKLSYAPFSPLKPNGDYVYHLL
jgi:hypothetical protein